MVSSNKITWDRNTGYEVSSLGDKRFSALYARFPSKYFNGRTIEEVYQCDVKGYDIGGTNWKLGKGKPPLNNKTKEVLWEEYLNLWKLWSTNNVDALRNLYWLVCLPEYKRCLSDKFAKTEINQARALSEILNEYVQYRGPNLNDVKYFHP